MTSPLPDTAAVNDTGHVAGHNLIVAAIRTKLDITAAAATYGAVVRPSGDTSGVTDIAAINAALAANPVVRLKGGLFHTNAPILQPSNTTLILEQAEVRIINGANCNVWRNKDQTAVGNANIYVKGIGRAFFNGNATGQTLQSGYNVINNLGMSAVRVTGLHVEGIQIASRFWAAFQQGVINATWRDIGLEQDRSVPIYQDGIDVGPGSSKITISGLRGVTGDDIVAIFGMQYESAVFGPYPLHPLYQPGSALPLDISDINISDIQVDGPYNVVRTFSDNTCTIKRVQIKDVRNLNPNNTLALFSTGAPDTYILAGRYPVPGCVSAVRVEGLGGRSAVPVSLDSHIDDLVVLNIDPVQLGAGKIVGTREGSFQPTVRNVVIDVSSKLGASLASMSSFRSGSTVTNLKLVSYAEYADPAGATSPGAPTALSATGGANSVALTWTAPTSNGNSAITGYTVYRSLTSGGAQTVVGNPTGTSFTDTGLTAGTAYFYKVAAVNAIATGPQSNEATATPTAGAGAVTSTFTGADSATTVPTADTGQVPTQRTGTWGIQNNALRSVTGADNDIITWPFTSANQTIRAVYSVASGNVGLVGRFIDINNFYIADVSATGATNIGVFIVKRVNGVYSSVLGTAGSGNNLVDGDTLDFEIIGTTLKIKKNGVTLATATDSSLTTSVAAGVRSHATLAANQTTRIDRLDIF